MATIIKIKRDTLANFTSNNPTLALGEMCWLTDTGRMKIGNGVDSFNDLGYLSPDPDGNFHVNLDLITSVSDDDELLIWSDSEEEYKRITRENFFKNNDFQVVSTIANAKTMSDVYENKIIYVAETDTIYKYITSGSTYTADDKYVIITVTGGNTRWIAVGGRILSNDMDLLDGKTYKINGITVVNSQQSAISDSSITTTETANGTYDNNEQDMLNHLKADITSHRNKINEMLDMLRTHGLIEE